MSARVFSDEELRVAGLRSVDALREALEAGDTGAAIRFVKRLRYEVLTMLASYDGWEATLADEIARHGGESARQDALSAIEDPESAPERSRPPGDGAAWRAEAAQIRAALEVGNDTEAIERAEELHEAALSCHDRGMSRVSALLSWIGRRLGNDAIEEALGKAMNSDMIGNAGFRERAEALMHFTRVHLQPFALEEDDEKLTFLCAVCPSGGRLLREGHYESPRDDLYVEGSSPLTWGRERLPAYCCHEPVMERASATLHGAPLFIVEPSDDLGAVPCKTYLYKDASKIPERYYTRVGLKKPA